MKKRTKLYAGNNLLKNMLTVTCRELLEKGQRSCSLSRRECMG